jgi:hypothetical protein
VLPTHPTIRQALLHDHERELRRRVRHAHHARPQNRRALRLRAVVVVARALRLGVAVERCAHEPATVRVSNG